MQVFLRKAVENVVRPAVHRVAGQAAMFIAGTGLVTQTVENIEAALVVIGGLAIDLLIRKVL